MSDIRAQIAFLEGIEAVTVEFEAAYETRREDKDRWEAAKAAFQEQRSYWRGVNEATRGELGEGVASVPSVTGKAKVHTDPDAPQAEVAPPVEEVVVTEEETN